MAPVREVSGGGAFLIRSLNPDDLFTPEDLTDEQRLFGRTAAEFMRNEVLPNEASLYAHDWAKTRELLKKAADLDLLRLEIPPDVRRPGSRQGQRRLRRRGTSPSIRRSPDSLGHAHVDWNACRLSTSERPSRRRSICPGSPAAS